MKRLLLIVCSMVVLVGCNSDKDVSKQDNVIIEHHEIVAIEGNEIYGENVNGSGEGIYYTFDEFEGMGISKNELIVGDVIAISWNEESFDDEEWEDIYSLSIVE